jgi:hypothetical protein
VTAGLSAGRPHPNGKGRCRSTARLAGRSGAIDSQEGVAFWRAGMNAVTPLVVSQVRLSHGVSRFVSVAVLALTVAPNTAEWITAAAACATVVIYVVLAIYAREPSR